MAAGHDRDRLAPQAARARRKARATRAPDPGLRLRALPREGLSRPEDVLGRGARRHRADARRGLRDGPHRGRPRRGDRDGSQRPPQRARPQHRPPRRVDPGRVRGRQGDRGRQVPGRDPDRRHRRRQVPLRPQRRLQGEGRLRDRGTPLSEPEPPRVRGPRCDRRRPRLPDHPYGGAPRARPDGRGPGAAPRRCGLPGPGRGGGDAQPPVAEGLRNRGHGPHHPEQPDRLHDRSGGGPLDPVRRRHGKGLQRPDHPRERRRPGGMRGRRSVWRWPTASVGAATWSST